MGLRIQALARQVGLVLLLALVPRVTGAAEELPQVLDRPLETLAPTAAWEDRLVRLFAEGALRDEIKRARPVTRWLGPIIVSVHGDAAGSFMAAVDAVAAELAEASGLAIEVKEAPPERGDIMVVLTWRKSYWPSAAAPVDPANRQFTCMAIPSSADGRMIRSEVHVNAGNVGVETAEACLLEEILQSLGLFGEVQDPATALFDGIGYRHLGQADRLLLRALYDRRLRAGAEGEEAMAQARPIIAELLRALSAPR